ncbi:MAG: hypothetical protein KBG39_07055 [Opitutaceae bacterium]|nr:hypothetical protein [Opitutaceae bacterium]MBP8962685.1 hypothetical protein [Opitutaceae bacterium]
MSLPTWLPEPLVVMPWNSGTYDLLYAVFCRDLLNGRLTYLGFNVWFYPDTEEDGREAIFWHLTSRDDKTIDPPVRLLDPRRSERLNWVRPMILRCPCATGDLRNWDHEEGDGAIKTYVWLHQHDFVIIMKKLRDGKRRLITSYHLDSAHERRKIEKKWNRRLS